MASLLIVVFFILTLDALVSAAEAAIYTISLHKARLLAKKSSFGQMLLSLKESMELPITTLNVLSNFIIIAGSVFTGLLATKAFGESWVGIFAAILTFLVMIFGEIVPKRFGERYSEFISLTAAPAIYFVSKVLFPVTVLIREITRPFMGVQPRTTSKEELALLADVAEQEGSIAEEENELIQKVMTFDDITAADIMTPKPFVTFVDGTKKIGELGEFIKDLKHSRLPVFEGDTDNIIGIVHQRNLLIALAGGEHNEPVKKYIWEAMMVPESRLIDDLLRDMRAKRTQLAVVVSDYGDVVGVVGIEDIIEELVGEIIDEKDVAPEFIKRVSKTEIIVNGQTRMNYVNHFFNTEIKSKKTLNGFLLEHLGRVPKISETHEYKGLTFIIEAANPREISRARIIKKEEVKL